MDRHLVDCVFLDVSGILWDCHLPAIPRVGELVDMGDIGVFRVDSVRWMLTTRRRVRLFVSKVSQ